MIKAIRYMIKYRAWPSRLQRDFMSRSARRQARVKAMADRIIAEMQDRGQDR